MNHLRHHNYKNETTERKELKQYAKNKVPKVKNSLLELEKDFRDFFKKKMKKRYKKQSEYSIKRQHTEKLKPHLNRKKIIIN